MEVRQGRVEDLERRAAGNIQGRMRINTQFWRGRHVLVTGHTGFAGSWLAATLHRLGARVTGIALAPEAPALFPLLAPRLNGITSHIADLRDPAAAPLVEKAAPEVVFHLAAESLVRRAYREPAATFATNVLGTVHVLEALRNAPSIRAAVLFTTDKVYASQEWVWPYRETDRLGGNEPYGASKAAAELAAAAYYHSYFAANGPGIATMRAGNLIGGGDFSADRLVPDFMRAAMRDTPLVVRRPQARRPWQFVMEPILAMLALAERLHAEPQAYSEAWNVGPALRDTVTVEELVRQLKQAWGDARMKVQLEKEPAGPPEAGTLAIDSAKLALRLGWNPVWTLSEAVAKTARWYKAHAEGDDMAEVTLHHIQEFLDAAA
ncbi:MAG: CDP-glucose 4,6-dehydratase [Alphaproteobacteria bacterium]|nr:CDP-glucose 4,6-dehydratase [Alphaproteobacteria bacterium]